ncbi:MAG TPA: hypothetical protein DCS07_02475, partial [Bdellovibrionales bacterium]|nr:hypothetical protein [Bdellovibrionales bacterium]
PASITLNPQTLRSALLEGNLSIQESLLRLHDAKDQINIARGNLLPYLNLGGLITSSGSPTFLLSSVQYLLPFLIPSNWFDYRAQKNLFEAEILSYRILQLNAYSSALSMYYTVLADQQYQNIYIEQAEDLRKVYETRRSQYVAGTISVEDLLQAQSQGLMAQIRASQMRALQKQEIAALRAALGLPLSTEIWIDSSAMPLSEWETGRSISDVAEEAFRLAPEQIQITWLEKAAIQQKWSRIFGFIGSASLSSQASVNGSGNSDHASFSDLKGSANIGIGFGYYPSIQLSDRSIDHIRLRLEELKQELKQTLEAELTSLDEYKGQLELASIVETNMRDVYDIVVNKFKFGLTDFVNVLTARAQLLDAGVARIKAQHDLNLLRVTLHRTMLSDQFAFVTGCNFSTPQKVNKGFRWPWQWGKGRKTSHKSLDELCKQN